MIEHERRMPRFKRLPKYTMPPEVRERIPSLEMSDDEINVLRLRHAKMCFGSFSAILEDEKIRKTFPPDRIAEIESNIRKVKQAKGYALLYSLLFEPAGNDAIDILVQKLVSLKPSVYDDVLESLGSDYTDMFFDNALILFYRCFDKEDISSKILSFLETNAVRDPLDFASLCMSLGSSKNEDLLDFLYSMYLFFKDNFPEDSYFEGPLLAMVDIVGA